MANPRKMEAEVICIEDYGRGVYRLTLQTADKMPVFQPGQFLHLTVDLYDISSGYWPESRVFSICSISADRKEISIVYSVKGKYTRKMEALLSVGSKLWIKLPYGDFIIEDYVSSSDQSVILIAGGTGISPYIPFINECSGQFDIMLYYGLRSSDLIIFEKELTDAIEYDSFILRMFFEEEENNIDFKGNFSKNMSEKLSVRRIVSDIKNLDQCIFFISGPPLMLSSFKSDLEDFGVAEEHIIMDEWS